MTKKKEPKKMGRPEKINPEILAKLEHAFALGESDENACRYAGINPSTLYRYQHENEDFCKRKEELKLNPILKAKNTIFKNLDDPKVAQWFLERKRKDEFSTTVKQEITGKGGEPLAIKKVFITAHDQQEADEHIKEMIND